MTDVTHSIPVQVNRNGLRAIAAGTGDSEYLELRHVAETADIKEGDLLVSSGLGQRFPSGYPVAQVKEVVRDWGSRSPSSARCRPPCSIAAAICCWFPGGTVSAEVIIEAAIKPKKVMPCAILGVSSELCDARSYSLIVRSNRFNDQVRINDQVHGATPVSLILESGEYDVQVTHEGVTQTRKLSLDDDRVVNFRF
ncbi:hypothetical protein SSTU70S_04605 [Stutzerimonas stutzeri]